MASDSTEYLFWEGVEVAPNLTETLFHRGEKSVREGADIRVVTKTISHG